ncbi:MAG: ABC transporter permease subunit, partial [Dehalococcoidales bacterium]|nr:ABC transporter permease subunit [Dehalococcoidales bacterium]
YAGTIGQMGVLVAVLVAMGAIASEVKRGTAVIALSKPVSYAAFVNSKFAAMGLTFIASLVAASLLCFAYTVWLIGEASVPTFIGVNLLVGLFLLFWLAVTLLCSSMFKSSLAAGGLAFGIIIAQALLTLIPVIGDYLPGKIMTWGNNLLIGSNTTYWGALVVTVALTALCLFLAQRILHKKEL